MTLVTAVRVSGSCYYVEMVTVAQCYKSTKKKKMTCGDVERKEIGKNKEKIQFHCWNI